MWQSSLWELISTLLSHLNDSVIDTLSTPEQQVLKDVFQGSVFTTRHSENTKITNLAPSINSTANSQDSYFLPTLSSCFWILSLSLALFLEIFLRYIVHKICKIYAIAHLIIWVEKQNKFRMGIQVKISAMEENAVKVLFYGMVERLLSQQW